ncbi:hypothetical protein [Microvirga sp. CF3016]|uniref:hypothetical protein n=1 Tax=Microvirga sp. CF3016 TaxID=3110181 RepID=UPI002E77C3BB|nr:hypothetical protein [Microvirga sp. CF3016]MEE1610170.1 hypothetical protein [Microvirga sp. CF3016]
MIDHSGIFVAVAWLSIASAAGVGIFLGIKRLASARPIDFDLSELLGLFPIGFAITYGIFVISHIASFGKSLDVGLFSLVATVIFGIAGLVVILIRKDISKTSAEDKKNYIICLFVALCTSVVPQIMLGSLPFVVSDSWTHISYINRLLLENSTMVSGVAMPHEVYALKFSPHHAFLATVGRLSQAQALDVWIGARYLFPIWLILAFLSFIAKAAPDVLSKPWQIGVLVFFFAVLFPTEDGVFRGSADYRIPAFILMFLLLRIGWSLIVQTGADNTIALTSMLLLSSVIAVTHVLELMLAILMLVPFSIAFWRRSNNRKQVIFIATWSFCSVAIALIVVRVAFTGYPVPIERATTYDRFLELYMGMLSHWIGWPALIGAVAATFFVPTKYVALKIFITTALLTAVSTSAVNPVVAYLLVPLVGANLFWRTMFVFPIYIPLALSLIYFISSAWNSAVRGDFARVAMQGCFGVALLTAVGFHLYYWWGFHGRVSYLQSDSISQLRLYPALYERLKTYNYKIVLSDTFTSAPINAVTSNYIYAHRPWTEGPEPGRLAVAANILHDPTSTESLMAICRAKIDLVVINRTRPPDRLKPELDEYAFVREGFYKDKVEFKKVSYLRFVGNFDGVDLYEVSRQSICSQ